MHPRKTVAKTLLANTFRPFSLSILPENPTVSNTAWSLVRCAVSMFHRRLWNRVNTHTDCGGAIPNTPSKFSHNCLCGLSYDIAVKIKLDEHIPPSFTWMSSPNSSKKKWSTMVKSWELPIDGCFSKRAILPFELKGDKLNKSRSYWHTKSASCHLITLKSITLSILIYKFGDFLSWS